jgi:cellulose synthase (UDP-forming)
MKRKPSDTTVVSEFQRSRISIATTLVVVVLASAYYVKIILWGGSPHPMSDMINFFVAGPLIYGSLVYQASRLGALKRKGMHRRLPQSELEQIYRQRAASLTILIPSYKEEPHILRQTLMSAALVEYPGRRVVVLIDDPPNDHVSRAASWNVITELRELLGSASQKYKFERDCYYTRKAAGKIDLPVEARRIARLYNELADWYQSIGDDWAREDRGEFSHARKFFINQSLLVPARAQRARSKEVLSKPIEATDIECEYNRLAESLSADISGFERKTYVNLSHMPNKAMNLNAYLGLLGGSFQIVDRSDGVVLQKCAKDDASLQVPGAEFVLTLDADSILLPQYALQLAKVMDSDARIAVIQTPYSAFPNAPTSLERTAGATTDIQYIAHQGSSYFNAAYWVGANALLRLSALQDVGTTVQERGYTVPVFIQDRTVIEDTGSTIDLIRNGWKIYNFPERLAYSATPSDFGALIIQRRRWSNGGLIILPDLVRYWLARAKHKATSAESLVRAHYLVSPAICSLGVLTFLLYPLEFTFSVILLPFAAGPYFYIYGRDLIRAGYVWSDLLRVYALNLVLLPVNLAGVLLSIRQIITGRKTSFERTPKVEGRTAVPPLYLGFTLVMLMIMVLSAVYSIASENYARALFPGLHVGFYVYGLAALIGVRASWEDLKLSIGLSRKGPPKVARLLIPLRVMDSRKAQRIVRAFKRAA